MTRLALKDVWHGLSVSAFGSLGMGVLIFSFLLLISLASTLSRFGEQAALPQNLIILESDVLQPEQSRIEPDLLDQVRSKLGPQAVRADPVVFRVMRVEEHPIQLRGVAREAWEVTFGLSLLEGKWPEDIDQVVVGQTLAELAGWRPGTTVEIYGRAYRVAGVAEASGTKTQTVWMTFEQASQLFRSDEWAQALVVHLDPLTDPLALRDRLLADLQPRGRFDVYLEDELIRQYATALQDLRALSLLVAAIGVAAVTVGSHNLGWLDAEERRRLLGVLRSLGFARRAIGQYLVLRALVTIGGAYLLALAAAVAVLSWGFEGQALLIGGSQSPLTLTPGIALLGLTLSLLSAAVGTGLAAFRILNTSPSTLLGSGAGEGAG